MEQKKREKRKTMIDYKPTEEFEKDRARLNEKYFCRAKPNPNKWPIIDKWNYKYVIAPSQAETFLAIQKEVNRTLFKRITDMVDDFAEIKDIRPTLTNSAGIQDFETFLNRLPNWQHYDPFSNEWEWELERRKGDK